jgi:integrase
VPVKLTEITTDHHGASLPKGVYASITTTGEIVSYKARWREEDENGVRGQRSKSFSAKKLGSLDQALKAALAYAEDVAKILNGRGAVEKVDAAGVMTVDDLFKEWLVGRAADLSPRYGVDSVRIWDRDVSSRPIAAVRLERLSQDPSIAVRFQDALVQEGLAPSRRRNILKLLRAVLRWGRRRHPGALTVDFSGIFELPPQRRNRLPYAADAVGVERIIEAILNRPTRDDLRPIRDAAFAAAMGFTVSSRPSEWRLSARWEDLHSDTVELQRAVEHDPEDISGLKRGAHVALLLPNARDRISTYREALEDRYGPQPDNGLIFQVLDMEEGPVWVTPPGGGPPAPLAMDVDSYNNWTARIWRPAREAAALAPDSPSGLGKMTFYDLRHTSISMALHSTLVMGPHGMNLHPLAGWAAHDIQTLQRYYAHFIARYQDNDPIDLKEECARARAQVESNPFKPEKPPPSPQRESQRRRRQRRRAAGEPARR